MVSPRPPCPVSNIFFPLNERNYIPVTVLIHLCYFSLIYCTPMKMPTFLVPFFAFYFLSFVFSLHNFALLLFPIKALLLGLYSPHKTSFPSVSILSQVNILARWSAQPDPGTRRPTYQVGSQCTQRYNFETYPLLLQCRGLSLRPPPPPPLRLGRPTCLLPQRPTPFRSYRLPN
jgi:hypothetical protein